jgi:hypothetical protein
MMKKKVIDTKEKIITLIRSFQRIPMKTIAADLERSLAACCTCGFFACSCKKSLIIGLLTQFVRYKYSFYEYLYHFMREAQQTARDCMGL